MQGLELLTSAISGAILQVIQERWQGSVTPTEKRMFSVLVNFLVACIVFLLINWDTNLDTYASINLLRNFVISYATNQITHQAVKKQ